MARSRARCSLSSPAVEGHPVPMIRICFVPVGLGHAQLVVDPAGSRLDRDMDELEFNVGVCRRFCLPSSVTRI